MTHADCTTECAIPCVVCERLFCFQCRTEVLSDEPRGGIKSGVFACDEHRELHERGDYRSVWELRKIAYERKQAALKEALDLAEANIFAPTNTTGFAAAAPPTFAAAQPMTLDGPLQLNVDPLAAVACAPPMQFGTTMTKVTVDTGKPYRDKARIAELRKENGL